MTGLLECEGSRMKLGGGGGELKERWGTEAYASLWELAIG